MRFVDTNILLYSLSTDPSEVRKRSQADAILVSPDLGLSVQVLQEFYVQTTRERPGAALLTREQAVEYVTALTRFPVQQTTVELVHAAMASQARYQISYWDAAIIEAARMLGCEEVLSEDLSHGQDYGGVRVTNPFRNLP